MALNWITVNANLKKGIGLINASPKDVFCETLKLVVEQLKNGTTFEREELQVLKDSSKLSEEDLLLVIQSLVYILKQASKVILKPTTLFKQLNETLKIDSEKADELVSVWTEGIKSSFDIENRKRLDNISWEMDLGTASNVCYKQTVPNARLQLGLLSVNSGEKENLILQLDEDELTSLFKTIENIQVKLDSIHNASKP